MRILGWGTYFDRILKSAWQFGLVFWWWNTHRLLKIHIGRTVFVVGFRNYAWFEEQKESE